VYCHTCGLLVENCKCSIMEVIVGNVLTEGSRILDRKMLDLAVKLTADEQLERGRSLAEALENIRGEEARQDSIKQQMKATIAELEARRDRLMSVVSRGEELRPVQCEDIATFSTGKMARVRLDTGEVIFERSLSDTERQEKLELSKAAH